MKVSEISGKYDAIFSLGRLCHTSIQLERIGLRPFSGVIDWMGSPNLTDVNRLLRCRFADFMDRSHLRYTNEVTATMLIVHETEYNIYSNHDFLTRRNSSDLETYPEVKAKFDRRIARFLRAVEQCDRLLFIRCGGTFEETKELSEVLSEMVANEFHLLLVQEETAATGLAEKEWPLDRVCAVEIPKFDSQFDAGYDPYWDRLLEGVEYDDSKGII